MTVFTSAPTLKRQEFLSPTELSAYIGIAVQTLARWRSEGRGPAYIKIGGKKVAYRISAVHSWLDQQDVHRFA